MFKVIRHHAKLRLEKQTDKLKLKRREVLSQSEEHQLNADYRRIVEEQTSIEE